MGQKSWLKRQRKLNKKRDCLSQLFSTEGLDSTVYVTNLSKVLAKKEPRCSGER
jgi:hypothetical protein